MTTFATLYKKTNTSAIQEWNISVIDNLDGLGVIVTKFGQSGGAIQTTHDVISKGKNHGKKNATSALFQAHKEAESKWTKQLKKGYTKTIEEAQAGKVDALVEGGIAPMLAHKYADHAHKITFPCYVQEKLDGIRCIAVVENGTCTLWSRTRRPIHSVPHIARAIEAQFPTGRHIFDGELYNHSYHDNFEQIVSLCRQDEPAEGHEIVQYHIYDFPSAENSFEMRTCALKAAIKPTMCLVLVDTILVQDEDGLTAAFEHFVSNKYEGLMVRNISGKYEEGKRSYHLQKVKEMLDAEFSILGIEEGRGKLAGHVAAFVCRLPNGNEVKAKPRGTLDQLKKWFEDHSLWQGKDLVIRYQGLTQDQSLRFPIGVRFRDSIDF